MVPKDVDIVSMADLIMVAERECMIQAYPVPVQSRAGICPENKAPWGRKGMTGVETSRG
jgi:hypothetical protein